MKNAFDRERPNGAKRSARASRRISHAKRRQGQKGQALDLSPFDAKRPSVVRVVDHALAFQGWTRSARNKILHALKHGLGNHLIAEVVDNTLDGLTELSKANSADATHATRCEEKSPALPPLGPPAQPRAADPID